MISSRCLRREICFHFYMWRVEGQEGSNAIPSVGKNSVAVTCENQEGYLVIESISVVNLILD